MANVHILGLPAVFQVPAGVIEDIVDGPDGIRVGPGAVFAKLNFPDQLCSGVFRPDGGHGVVVQAAVLQHKGLAVCHDCQSLLQSGNIVLCQGKILEFHAAVVGGDLFAEEGEGVVKAGVGGCVDQPLHIGLAEACGSVGAHKLHTFQLGESCKDFLGGVDLPGGQLGKVQGGGVGGEFLTGQPQGVGDFQIGVGVLQVAELIGCENGFGKNQALGVFQVGKICHQRFVVRFLGSQRDLRCPVGNGFFPQVHRIDDVHVRMPGGIGLQGGVGGGARGIQQLQVFVIFQVTQIFIGDDHFKLCLQILGGSGLGCSLRCLRDGIRFSTADKQECKQCNRTFFRESVQAHGVWPPVNIMH